MAAAEPAQRISLHGSTPEALAALSAALAEDAADADAPQLAFGAPPADAGSAFAPDAFFGALSSKRAGHALLLAGDTASTQEYMRRHSSRLPDGALFVADRQSSGRGRGGNVWASPPGCLMFTLCSHVRIGGAQAPYINYVVCLAVTQALQAAADEALPGLALDVRIKWPNDIYYRGLKIGGALIHTTWQAGRFNVLTGIGLNLSNRTPTTCVDAILEDALTAAGRPELFAPLRREALLGHLMAAFEACFDAFQAGGGFAPLQPRYLAAWLHSGQEVELEEDAGAEGAGVEGGGARLRTRLTIQGLSASGFLLALDAAGTAYELTPDGNSLDMMRGLVRRKLPA